MSAKPIRIMGDPVLREKATVLTTEEINSPETKSLIDDMYATMQELGGIGIAAPQIGVSKQVTIIELDPTSERYNIANGQNKLIIINPVLTILDETLQGFWEGCLSVPGLRGFVERPQKLKISFQNENAEIQELIVDGFLATVFQHELDHLFGTLYIDRIQDTKLLMFEKMYDSLLEESEASSDSE